MLSATKHYPFQKGQLGFIYKYYEIITDTWIRSI